jgi:hypothetical protein
VEAAVWPDDIKEMGMDYMDYWHFTNKPINFDGYLSIVNNNLGRSTLNKISQLILTRLRLWRVFIQS